MSSNTASNNGGGVYLDATSAAVVADSVFEGSSAVSGGVVYLSSGASVDGFARNSGARNDALRGGVAYIGGYARLHSNHSSFATAAPRSARHLRRRDRAPREPQRHARRAARDRRGGALYAASSRRSPSSAAASSAAPGDVGRGRPLRRERRAAAAERTGPRYRRRSGVALYAMSSSAELVGCAFEENPRRRAAPALVSGAVADVNRIASRRTRPARAARRTSGRARGARAPRREPRVRPRRRGVLAGGSSLALDSVAAEANRRAARRRRGVPRVGVGGDGDQHDTRAQRRDATAAPASTAARPSRRGAGALENNTAKADGGALALGAARAGAIGARLLAIGRRERRRVALAAPRASISSTAPIASSRISARARGGLFMANSPLRVASTAESDYARRRASSAGDEFVANRAGVAGGALFWNWETMGGEPSALASVALRDNTARGYGAALATPARSIVAAHDNTTEEVSGTGAFRAPVVVTAYDAYGQRTTTSADADGARVTLSCETASLGGSYSNLAMADGECVVDEVSAMLGPSVAIELAAELAFTTPAGSALRLSDTVGVYLRACQSGEYVSGADGARQCLTCEAPAFRVRTGRDRVPRVPRERAAVRRQRDRYPQGLLARAVPGRPRGRLRDERAVRERRLAVPHRSRVHERTVVQGRQRDDGGAVQVWPPRAALR